MPTLTTSNPSVARVMFSSASDDWATPQAFYNELDAEFGFVLDACSSTANHKAPHFFALDHHDADRRDGLAGDWAADAIAHGGAVWLNPVYGRSIGDWMAKAAATARAGATVVCLVPARTDTRWFHDHVLAEGAEVRYVRGRLKFGNATTGAPFASLVVIYRGAPADAELVPAGSDGEAEDPFELGDLAQVRPGSTVDYLQDDGARQVHASVLLGEATALQCPALVQSHFAGIARNCRRIRAGLTGAQLIEDVVGRQPFYATQKSRGALRSAQSCGDSLQPSYTPASDSPTSATSSCGGSLGGLSGDSPPCRRAAAASAAVLLEQPCRSRAVLRLPAFRAPRRLSVEDDLRSRAPMSTQRGLVRVQVLERGLNLSRGPPAFLG